MPCQNGGRPSSGASSSDRAAARAFCEREKPARDLGEFAMVVGQCDTHGRAFLLDAVGRWERVYLNPAASQPSGRSAGDDG